MESASLENSRSLIQKAIRRADVMMVHRAASHLFSLRDFQWLRNRLAVLTFEECWTYGSQVSFEDDPKIILNHLLKLASTVKNRNAAGLGSLAYIYSQGDETVLDGDKGDEHVKFIANSISDTKEFWLWTSKQPATGEGKKLIKNAHASFDKAEQPWDKAFTMAGAYLAITEKIPATKFVEPASGKEFPLWIAIDMHTIAGTEAIREAAWQINFDQEKAPWLTFYMEGVTCNAIEFSPWWVRETAWRMKSLGLTIDDAVKVWEKLRPVVIELQADEPARYKEELFSVKLL